MGQDGILRAVGNRPLPARYQGHSMRVIFLGTPEFAVPTLDRIVAAGHSVSMVVTQPDRPKGRKQELNPSPVKAFALRHSIPALGAVESPAVIRYTPPPTVRSWRNGRRASLRCLWG